MLISFKQHIHESDDLWSQYYPETKTYTKKSANEPITSVSGSYYVLDALFTAHKTQCIYLSSNSDNKLLVSSTTFSELSGQVEGLAIKQDSGGHCIQFHVCNFNPDSSNRGAHSWIRSPESDNCTNCYFFESSISSAKCDYSAFLQYYGDNQIRQVNVSHAVGNYNTVCDTIGASISSCTFYNNTANQGRVLYLGEIDSNITQCNIISNKDSGIDPLNGLVHNDGGDLKVTKTIFDNNTVKYLFYYYNVYPGTITVSECYFNENHISLSSNRDEVKITPTNKFENHLEHFSTNKCEAIQYKEETEERIPYNYYFFPFYFEIFNIPDIT